MRLVIQRLLYSLRITLRYTDPEDESTQYYFNVLNPLGWLLIIVWGLGEGVARWFQFIWFTVKEGVRLERIARTPRKASANSPVIVDRQGRDIPKTAKSA